MPLLIAAVVLLVWLFWPQLAGGDTGDINSNINLGDLIPVAFKDRLTAADIAQFARAAGFSGYDLVQAVAIALAESGGNPKAYNPEVAAKGGTPTGQGSYGLWQIYSKVHPEFATWDLFDPQTNANAAFLVYRQRGDFTAWSTYNGGQYQAYLQAAENGVSA